MKKLFRIAAIIALAIIGGNWTHGSPALAFNGGIQTRGLLMWEPVGGAFNGCTPANCYTGNGTVATQLPTAKLNQLCSSGVGHLRLGFDPSPILSDPTNTASYLASLDAAVTQILTSCLKVVVNVAPNANFTGWSADDIADGGPASTKFLTYLSALNVIATNINSNYSPASVAIGVFNEMPPAGNVTGGINAQYSELKLMFQAVRTVAPKFTIALCLSDACDIYQQTAFASWNSADFDANTWIDFHVYAPQVAAWSGQPGTEWRDFYNAAAVYPPPNNMTAYNTALAQYETQLAADNTWAGDCPSGSNCTAARAANLATMTGEFNSDGLLCYYGQGFQSVPPSQQGQCQNRAQAGPWIVGLYSLIQTWLPAGVAAKQIYIGEFGINGTYTLGSGVGTGAGCATNGQACALGDVAAAIDGYGFNRATLEVNYSAAGSAGSGFGLVNQNSPYAYINSAAITALNFNGQ